jgi:hypothetical protein
VQERITDDKPDPGFDEIDVNCKFIKGRSGDTDSNDTFTPMSVRLEVTDKDGDQNTSLETSGWISTVCARKRTTTINI